MVVRVDFDKAVLSDYSGQPGFQIDSEVTDGAGEQKETRWFNSNWNKYWGYFSNVGDLKSAFLMKSIWTVGKGWTADPATTLRLEHIRGWGKDTFDDILFNADLIKNVGGDSYCHSIRDEVGALINLKPLDPGSMVHVVGADGLLTGYEQISRIKGKAVKKFKTAEIFHLTNNRLADQIHGISDIDALEKTILADGESFSDMQKLMHFQAKPFIVFKMKTDDTTKIAAFVKKVEDGRKAGEDLFIPDDENLLTFEVVQVNPSNVIMEWRRDLKNKFYRTLGLPLIIFGESGSTESGGKIEFQGHQQVWEYNQRYLEKQLWSQLGIKIDLISPASLLDELKEDESKDADQGLEFQKSDVTAGVGA